MILLQQMMILFLIMIIGFICRKKGILNDSGSKTLSAIVVNVANPALVLTAGINKDTSIQGKDLLITVGLAVGMFVAFIIFAELLVRIMKVKISARGAYKAMTVFSNIGFMGFPVISAVYGTEALLYASVFLIPYNVLIYTYGINAMSSSDKSGHADTQKGVQWAKIFNIGVIASIITIILYFTGISLPYVLESTITTVSNLTAPLSMIVIGDAMANMKLKEMLTDKKLLVFSAVKLLFIPFVGISFLRLFGLSDMLMGVCLIMLSTPVGSMTAMLAQQYNGEYELASKGVALTTLLSVATMPLIAAVLGM